MGKDNNAEVSVKISHGNEIRRATIPSASYSLLIEYIAKLFNVNEDTIVIKYEDDDGDKISMSSDMEFHEALRVAQAMQKILRLSVELKSNNKEPSAPTELPRESGGESGRYGLPPSPCLPHQSQSINSNSNSQSINLNSNSQSQFSHPLPPPPPHHHSHPHSHPHSFHSSHYNNNNNNNYHHYRIPHHPPPPHFSSTNQFYSPSTSFTSTSSSSSTSLSSPSLSPASDSKLPQQETQPQASYGGYFGPQSTLGQGCSQRPQYDWKQQHREHKEKMRMMRDQFREMKRGASSHEDKMKLKEMKGEMKADFRHTRREMKCEKKQKYVARHVMDVTIPDGSELPPNTPFIKTWRIRNEGPAWPAGCALVFISHKGDHLQGPEQTIINGEVQTGEEIDVSVPLVSPASPGRYVGYYRMVTKDMKKFGQRVWVSFVVVQPSTVTTPL